MLVSNGKSTSKVTRVKIAQTTSAHGGQPSGQSLQKTTRTQIPVSVPNFISTEADLKEFSTLPVGSAERGAVGDPDALNTENKRPDSHEKAGRSKLNKTKLQSDKAKLQSDLISGVKTTVVITGSDDSVSIVQRTRKKRSPTRAIDRISIPALKEIMKADTLTTKRIWIGIMITSFCLMVYYTVQLILTFVTTGMVTSYQYVPVSRLPFPLIHVCVIGGGNKTVLDNDLPITETIVNDQLSAYARNILQRNNVSVSVLKEEYMKYASYMPNEEPLFDPLLIPVFNELLEIHYPRYNAKNHSLLETLYTSLLPCDRVVSNCKFNGRPFTCCPNTPRMATILEENICYRINPTETMEGVAYQTQLGWSAGLVFDTTVDTNYLLDRYVSTTGVRLHVTKDLSVTNVPVYAPSDTAAYVRLSLTANKLQEGCYDRNRVTGRIDYMKNLDPFFQKNFGEEVQKMSYGPGQCFYYYAINAMARNCRCIHIFGEMIRPPPEYVCSPQHMYSCVRLGVIGMSNELRLTYRNQADSVFVDLVRNRRQYCLPLCDSYDYQTSVSFTNFPFTEYEHYSNEGGKKDGILRNRYHISFGELQYLQTSEERVMNSYAFIVKFGFVLGLWFGMSAITIVQLAVLGFMSFLMNSRYYKTPEAA